MNATSRRVTVPIEKQQSKPEHPEPIPPAPAAKLPQLCTGTGKGCYPPEDFVGLLCQEKYSGVAIKMFDKAAPWQHVYLKVRDVAPVNSHGGPTASTRLEWLEEVIVLRLRPNKYRQMVADMPQSYDVLRLDGTCATLAEDEFTTRRPPLPYLPRYAPFVWAQIDPAIRRALSQDVKVEKARQGQTELCLGTILTGGSGACREATQQLARAILNAVNNGSPLPLPEELPEWPSISEATARAENSTR
jgi:hypothetical protein